MFGQIGVCQVNCPDTMVWYFHLMRPFYSYSVFISMVSQSSKSFRTSGKINFLEQKTLMCRPK